MIHELETTPGFVNQNLVLNNNEMDVDVVDGLNNALSTVQIVHCPTDRIKIKPGGESTLF